MGLNKSFTTINKPVSKFFIIVAIRLKKNLVENHNLHQRTEREGFRI